MQNAYNFTIFDFPRRSCGRFTIFRARRAPSTATAPKSAAGTHFQWTDTQNDIYIGLTDKISGWEPLSEHSKLFLLLFERVVSLR